MIHLAQSQAPSRGTINVKREDKEELSIMTNKIAACAIAASVVAVTASFPLPAFAQDAWAHSDHTQRMISNSAAYRAGLRHGIAVRSAYNQGFRDGVGRIADRSRTYVSYSYAPVPVAPNYRYSSYGPALATPSYNGLYASYGDSVERRYEINSSPVEDLVNVPSASLVYSPGATQSVALSYCAARPQSFYPTSGTYLASDGNYYCR
jgi:hypothetical protein